jgi:hypothetical protein
MLLSLPAIACAQDVPRWTEGAASQNTIVVVWAAKRPALSRDFEVSALKTMAVFREWQSLLSYALRNSYPLPEYWIGVHSDRAMEALRSATSSASTDDDQTLTNELRTQYENLRLWNDELIDARKRMDLGKYYMSAAAIDNDPLFQRTVGCAEVLDSILMGRRSKDGSAAMSCR